MTERIKETWNSRIGVILAVSGSAVGLGNFLRFPGKAAQFGGGAFMLAYFISFLIIGLPICWAEWTMGRQGGRYGFNSCPGILNAIVRKPYAKYLGIIGFIIPVIIYMYYVNIEAWCLGYAAHFALGDMQFGNAAESGAFWGKFIGIGSDGSAMGFHMDQVGFFLFVVFLLNFYLIYRGLNRGIELFCKYAMPTLVLLAVVILVRVLTLGAPDAAHPNNNVANGLGFMWNPNKVFLHETMIFTGQKPDVETIRATGKDVLEVTELEKDQYRVRTKIELVGKSVIAKAKAQVENDPSHREIVTITVWKQLRNPNLWLEAAGQIFFSLSVGFGIILTYASYLSRKDDIVLSGLAATSANEFCEVGLGGLISVPAAYAFLGVAGVAGQGTFGLGFNVLPLVFAEMPAGELFGFLFFFLLFLAAVTSSLSMLQPGIAFMEEAMGINRKQSVAILGIITAVGCMFVAYFSAGIKALDTLDFWCGTFLIFILATIQIIIFSWNLGIEKGFEVAHQGAIMKIPSFFKPIMKFVTPAFLLIIFFLWILVNVFGWDFQTGEKAVSGYVTDLFSEEPNEVAWMSVLLIIATGMFCGLIIAGVQKYKDFAKKGGQNI